MWIGLGVMFTLIGLAAVFGVLFGAGVFLAIGIWSWIWNLIGLFIFLWFLFFIFRVFVRPWRFHRYYNFWDHDDAIETLRQRYARGEIGKEQYEQMMNDLKR